MLLVRNSGRLTLVRHYFIVTREKFRSPYLGKAHQLQEQRYTHSYQCVQYLCVSKQWYGCQSLVFLPCARCWCMRLHTGLYGHRKRVCTGSWLWEKNPLPQRGLEPASLLRLALQLDALQLSYPCPRLCIVVVVWVWQWWWLAEPTPRDFSGVVWALTSGCGYMVTTTPTVVVCSESVMCPCCPTWGRPSLCRRALSSSLGTWNPCCSRRRCWRRSWCKRRSPWTRSPWGTCSGIGVLCSTPARRAASTCIKHTIEMHCNELIFSSSEAKPIPFVLSTLSSWAGSSFLYVLVCVALAVVYVWCSFFSSS